MLLAEYSYDLDMQVKQEEARKESKLEGKREGKVETARKMKMLGADSNFIQQTTVICHI